MRAISLVKKIEFEFAGNVVRNALTLGDVDNDGCIELIVGNDQGEIAIFKGRKKEQTITNLSFITCVAVGDVRNENRNSLVVVTTDGWCYIYEVPLQMPEDNTEDNSNVEDETKTSTDEVDGQIQSSSNVPTSSTNTETQSSSESTSHGEKSSNSKEQLKNSLVCVHMQRIPANVKNIVLGDVDGDGLNEMVLGLTDRVVRSYRFIKDPEKTAIDFLEERASPEDKLLGKFIALNKWECANQIGSITLHHSLDGKPSILVAQPGGTFMRINCRIEDSEREFENKLSRSDSSSSENFPGSVDYQFLGISRMRNQNISTEILGDLKCSNSSQKTAADNSNDNGQCVTKGRPYAVATLDGTIMLVQDEIILWAIAVDHQIFALTKLDVTGNGSDDIVVCSWDGQTYILDQNKNSVRFHLEEPVRAFHSGLYNLDVNEPAVTALVYVTFKNSIILYYDIPFRDLICKKFEPDVEKLSELFIDKNRTREQASELVKSMDKKTKRELVEYLLYDARC